MKNILILCLIFIGAISCTTDNINPENTNSLSSVCNVTDPLKELPWLKAMIDEATSEEPSDYCRATSVTQGVYNGQTVFIPVLGGALCCTCGNAVYNCAGEMLFSCDMGKEAEIKDKKVIWQKVN